MNERPFLISYPLNDRIQFASRLSLFLRSGIPILVALSLMRESANTRSARHILATLCESVASGHSLADSMDRFKKLFGEFAVTIVHVGETSGKLEESLSSIASALGKNAALQRTLLGALIYPAIIIVLTFGIIVFLTVYAFPKIIPLFRGFGTQLPLSTRIVIAVSDFMSVAWPYLIATILVTASAYVWGRQKSKFRLITDKLFLTIPLLGSLIRTYHLSLASRTLGMLLRSGIGIIPAFELAAEAAGNCAYREALHRTRNRILEGGRIELALANESACFPSLFVQIVAGGEQTGTLGMSFVTLGDLYETELDTKARLLSSLIEPALMILTGVLVGFIALAVISPVYQLTNGMGSAL